MSFRTGIRFVSLAAFTALLIMAVVSSPLIAVPDMFLLLDPGLVLLTVIGGRTVAPGYLAAVCVLGLTLLAGRIFCGYLCPLGICIDVSDRLCLSNRASFKRSGFSLTPETGIPAATDQKLKAIKYYFLAFLVGSALVGVSLAFLGAPLSLVTRFFVLIIYPVISAAIHLFWGLMRPLAEILDWRGALFFQLLTPRFATQGFILCFLAAVLIFSRFSSRFWCRYLCPTGALIALCARKPYIRRAVDHHCIACGKCVGFCPMSAIPEAAPQTTTHQECIVCRACEQVCPVGAVRFSRERQRQPEAPAYWERRRFLRYGLAGSGTAMAALTGLYAPYPNPGEGGMAAEILRPPGAATERQFLSRCVRCGECMAVCPTNTLQPIWFEAGWLGAFSPEITPGRGYCNPKCHRCSQACPTGAIRSVSPAERIWARPGTAVILHHKCLAWERHKPCMVCDEVCPYDAIAFKQPPGVKVAVPFIDADKCGGCGYCEHFCPVKPLAAIKVIPTGEIRLNQGSYQDEGRRLGLNLSLAPNIVTIHEQIIENPEVAPGFEALEP